MGEIFFTSDTHFRHENILKFEGGRHEFSSIEEMDEALVRNWNSVIHQQDKVYHLGDVTFKYDAKFNEIMSRLRGHKRLIVGNHDSIKNVNLHRWFEKIDLWTGGKFKHLGFIASHIPIHPDHFRKVPLNVHGHTHRNSVTEKIRSRVDSLDPRYMNVCVEQTEYTPIHVSKILERVSELS